MNFQGYTNCTKECGYASCMPKPKEQGLSDAIKAKVDELGLTMVNASIGIGQAPNALSRWHNRIEPGAQYYGVLMDFLGVSLEELGATIVRDQLDPSGTPPAVTGSQRSATSSSQLARLRSSPACSRHSVISSFSPIVHLLLVPPPRPAPCVATNGHRAKTAPGLFFRTRS